ncbi:hypothetical protein PsorP6_018051 [Peronosclerospora sorghi]|uniref:Uncharacterized protein n=1 Tax=Peronosclerospora sorghi TaxID=230839 RepID=A0ACC0WCV0_9STRA|nr:hypothetical protein PsorP6_018051 [Peronosclerospora sorghi]
MAVTFNVDGVRVAQDPVKGKVVVSERAFKPGQVLFSEEAFVAASWSTEVCGGCEELRPLSASNGSDESVPRCYCERTGAPKAMYTSRLQENVERRHVVVSIMKNIEGIDEVDRARCIRKCLALYERDANALADVMGLTFTNKQRACDAALQLRPSNGSDESVPRCYCERTGAPKAMYTSRLQENVERRHVVVSIMKNIEGIDEVDRARCIRKCLALYERDANALADVMGLTFTNKQRACDAALQLRRQLPNVFPAGFSDDQMATLIGVLNTNSRT